MIATTILTEDINGVRTAVAGAYVTVTFMKPNQDVKTQGVYTDVAGKAVAVYDPTMDTPVVYGDYGIFVSFAGDAGRKPSQSPTVTVSYNAPVPPVKNTTYLSLSVV